MLAGLRLGPYSSDRVLASPAPTNFLLLPPTHRGVNAVVWSYDGTKLATGLDNHSIKIWDLVTIECLGAFDEHDNSVLSLAW